MYTNRKLKVQFEFLKMLQLMFFILNRKNWIGDNDILYLAAAADPLPGFHLKPFLTRHLCLKLNVKPSLHLFMYPSM